MVERQSIELADNGQFPVTIASNGSRDLRLIDGIEEVGQSVSIRLRTRRGSDPHFPNAGVPFKSILGPLDSEAAAAIFRDEALKDEFVGVVDEVVVGFDDEAAVLARNPRARLSFTKTDGSSGTATI